MSRLKVTNTPATRQEVDPAPDGNAGPFGTTGYGTVVELDGKEIRLVRSIEIGRISVDDVMTAKIEVLASEAYEIELDASVTVAFFAFPGFQLTERVNEDGSKVYVVEALATCV